MGVEARMPLYSRRPEIALAPESVEVRRVGSMQRVVGKDEIGA